MTDDIYNLNSTPNDRIEKLFNYNNLPLDLGLVKDKDNCKVTFNLLSLLQLKDKIKLTLLKNMAVTEQCR